MLLWKFDKGRSETFLRVFKLRRRKRISQSTTKPPPILSAAANCACNCRANSASPAVASAPREPPLANTELEPLAAIVFSADAVDATADADSSCALCSLHRRPTSTITCFCGVPAGSDRANVFHVKLRKLGVWVPLPASTPASAACASARLCWRTVLVELA